MLTDDTNILGIGEAVNSGPPPSAEGCHDLRQSEPNMPQSRNLNKSNAVPSPPSADKQHRQRQPRDYTLGSPPKDTPADTVPHSSSLPPKDIPETLATPASKRVTRKHNNVSFGSPLAQQIATPNTASLPPSNATRLHHRPHVTSPASSVPFSTSAQQLALIQQRYVAEQDIAHQQRRLQKQLTMSPSLTSPRGWFLRSNDTTYTLPTSDISATEGSEGEAGIEQKDLHSNRRDSEADADVARRVVRSQNSHFQLQEQLLNVPRVPVVPTISNFAELHPTDVKQTNDALAQQLAMLTLINQFKTSESHASQGGIKLMQAHGASGGYVHNARTDHETTPRRVSGIFADHMLPGKSNFIGSPFLGAVLGTRMDPLFNPGNTSNVYINNLPTAFTEAHLYKLCATFGTILSVRMMLRDTGTCYGFVLFETVEAAESCIMWLRQFSDVHPSFARTPLKTVAHKLLDHQYTSSLRGVDSSESRLASPIRFTRVSAGDDSNGVVCGPSPDQTHPHVSANDCSIHIPSQSRPMALSDVKKSHLNKDIRPSSGRLGPIGLQQLFPQRDPASVNAIVSAAAEAPITPSPRGAVVPSTVEPGNLSKNTSSCAPNLLVDGLPSTVDLPSLEGLFSPHRVLSARFFRITNAPNTTITDPVRVVALVRLETPDAAEESIDKYNGRVIPGWTPPGMKMAVSFADSDHQGRLTLSEQRIQSILSRNTDNLDSPLDRKSRSLYRTTQPPPSSFVSTLSGSIFSKPVTRKSSHELSSTSKRLSADGARIRALLESNSVDTKSGGESFTDSANDDTRMRAVGGSPDRLYKVPDNTPAKSASAHSGRTSPRYIVQLPANYLERRHTLIAHNSDGEEDKTLGPHTIVDGTFPMPAPSLFKAARKSAPVRIRAPSEDLAKGAIDYPHVSGTEFHTPEFGRNAECGDSDRSPTTTLGTATPATSAGPFTPSTTSTQCSPALADQKTTNAIECNQRTIHHSVEVISNEPL